jgi:uncharacterized membrane protein
MGVFGSIYWCDGVIYIAAYLMDPFAAFIIGGIGSFLYDIIHGNAAMMFVSLIIHGLQGASVSILFHYVFGQKLFSKKLEPVWALVASLVGALVIIAGYFINRYFINGYELQTCLFKMVGNVVQSIVGITLAMVICYATTFKKQLQKNHLLPDFKAEVLEGSAQ